MLEKGPGVQGAQDSEGNALEVFACDEAAGGRPVEPSGERPRVLHGGGRTLGVVDAMKRDSALAESGHTGRFAREILQNSGEQRGELLVERLIARPRGE